MAHEQIHEHAERREGIGAEDAPPGQLAEDGMGEPDEHRQEEDLEAHERDEHDEQAARLTLGRDDEVGDEHADHREHHAVEHRVLHDEVVVTGTAAGSDTPGRSPRLGVPAFGAGGRGLRRRSGTTRRRWRLR